MSWIIIATNKMLQAKANGDMVAYFYWKEMLES